MSGRYPTALRTQFQKKPYTRIYVDWERHRTLCSPSSGSVTDLDISGILDRIKPYQQFFAMLA